MPKKTWTDAEFSLAFDLHLKGLTYAEIGQKLGRSGVSVQRKMEYQGVNQKRQCERRDYPTLKDAVEEVAKVIDVHPRIAAAGIMNMYRQGYWKP